MLTQSSHNTFDLFYVVHLQFFLNHGKGFQGVGCTYYTYSLTPELQIGVGISLNSGISCSLLLLIYTQNQRKRNSCIFDIFPSWTCQSKFCCQQTIVLYIFYQKTVICID